ncbi:hypothetical protein RE432_00595 [Pusillimonas sp. SM2304]|uniref:hypothetical protein n=1 Tax=Pusillimonas sp. SM2304 TaxID=3073241 RepID=UPI002875CE97|nr:hypothetical protein [Pusillimonas sp. SM2304]MDS1138915.1 hypothetical protein [Pusillimonas sp. SM2304]
MNHHYSNRLAWPASLGAALLIFLGLLLTPLQGMAAGILQLSHTEVRLEPGVAAAELYAENKGDTPLFLDVEQKLLLNPGRSPERLVPIQQVDQPTLLVTPDRLVLAPGQKYRMTLKTLAIPTSHRVWRVTFRPRQRVLVESGGEHADSAPLIMSVGYGVLIYQLAPAI